MSSAAVYDRQRCVVGEPGGSRPSGSFFSSAGGEGTRIGERLALFGSVARDTARADSDIDILVGFDGPATSDRYFGVQFFLEDLFGCGVDLVTERALRPELRPYIEREAVDV